MLLEQRGSCSAQLPEQCHTEDDDVIAERLVALEAYLQKVVEDPQMVLRAAQSHPFSLR